MIFTDNDLSRLKERLSCNAYPPTINVPTDDMNALLARLEAAEAMTKDFVEHGILQCGPCMKRIVAWRKAAGKLKKPWELCACGEASAPHTIAEHA